MEHIEDQEKFYYTIGEVSKMLDTTSSQLRYWGVEFGLVVKKNRKGDRLYQKEDVEKLKKIQFLLKNKRLTIEGAKMELKNKQSNLVEELNQTQEEQMTLQATINKLKNIKAGLTELLENI
jgi:DNA-binding transcriptional MerR regulator